MQTSSKKASTFKVLSSNLENMLLTSYPTDKWAKHMQKAVSYSSNEATSQDKK